MQKDLQRWISGTSFLSTVLVVVLHFSFFSNITGDSFFSNIILCFSNGIATVAVPTFFFFSGYLLFRNVEKPGDLLNKLKKRVKTLIVPYIFWNIVYMAVLISGSIYKKGVSGSDISFKNILYGVFLHKYIFNMWFLLVLIINTFLFSFGLIYLRKHKLLSIIAAVFLAVAAFFLKFTIRYPDNNTILFSLPFFVYWFIGCLCTDKSIEFCFEFLRKRKCYVIAFSSAVILLLAYPTMLAKNNIAFVELENLLVFILTVAFLAFTIVTAEHLLVTKENMGMMIYGAHGLFGIAVTNICFKIKDYIGNGVLTLILYVVTILLTVIIIYFTGVFIKRHIPQLYKISAGGR